ncbi:MAG: hypothetical protein ABIG89_06165 [Candidatus Woesearchaeota archaeon]
MILKKYVTKDNYKMYMLIIVVILLILPTLLRYIMMGKIVLADDQAYQDLSISDMLRDKDISFTESIHDLLIVPSRPIITTPYHLLIGHLGNFFRTELITIFLMIMLGVISLLLFEKILSRFEIPYFQRFIIIIFLALSPLFLYNFLIPTQTHFIIFLQLLGFYLYSNKDIRYLRYLSIIPYILLPFFGIVHTMIAIIIFVSYDILENKTYLFYLIPLSMLMIIISLYFSFPIYYKYGFIKTSIISGNLFQYYITDFGSKQGFSIFGVILMIFGLIKTWKEKYTKNYLWIYIFLIFLLILSFFYSRYEGYLNFVVMIFAGIGFLYLFEIKWEMKIIKRFTILIIILGLLFSGVSFIKRISASNPSQEMIESLDWLRHESSKNSEESVILSHPEYSHIVKYYTRKKVFIDSNQNYIGDYPYFIKVLDTIYQSRSLKEVIPILERYDIRFILITQEMKEGLVWDKDEQGLLFLLENSDRFKQLYSKHGIEIWKFNKIT